MRILCILLPNFPLRCEVLGNPGIGDSPVLIIYGTGSKKLVLDWSPELEGIKKDMPLQQALARQDRVEIVQADLPRYNSAFNMILDKLEKVSPLVENAGLGAAYLSIDGLRLYTRFTSPAGFSTPGFASDDECRSFHCSAYFLRCHQGISFGWKQTSKNQDTSSSVGRQHRQVIR